MLISGTPCPKCNLVKQNILTYEEMLYVGQNFIKSKWLELLNGKVKRDGEEKR